MGMSPIDLDAGGDDNNSQDKTSMDRTSPSQRERTNAPPLGFAFRMVVVIGSGFLAARADQQFLT